MPIPTAHVNNTSDDSNAFKSDKFADLNTVLSFPKECITSKMIKLTNHENAFMVSCLSTDPFLFVSDTQIQAPLYENTNDLIPLKPIQKLASFAESNQALALSHGNNELEFGKITKIDNEFVISRFCQKTIDKPFKKLSFSSDNNLFYGKSEMNLEYYDFKRISRVGLLESKFSISDFDVCPFNPSISAYLNGTFNIVDVRDNNKHLVLYQNQNNINCGNIIKWNPIVPYWIATATNTSLNFYDIRYNSGSPISTIKHGNIHELCWSSGNSDLILANSRDRRMNLWSLNHSEDDCRLGMTMTRFDIGSLTSDLNSLNMFYGLDDSDSLIKIEIRSEYLSKLAPIDDTVDSEFQIIEESIYAGDFDNIKRKLEQISSESDYKTLKNLVSLLSRKFIKNSRQEPFDETLISSITRTSSSTILKANNIMSSGQVLTEIQNLIDKLRLKIRLIELLAANDFESLKKFSKLIVSEICKNENFLEVKDSIKLFALILKNDRSMALNFLKEFIEANPFGISENLKIWIWMFVFPSIFDAKSYELIKIRPSLSKSIVNCHDDSEDVDDSWENYLSTIRNQFYDSILNSKEDLIQENQKIIQQVYLNLEGNPIKLEKFLTLEACLFNRDGTDNVFYEFEKDILDEKEEGEPIISAELIKILLEKSFKTSSKTSKTTFLRDFFLLAFRLTVLTERTPINLAISEFISTVAFSKLKLILSTLENSETLKAAAIEMLNEIVNDSYCTFTDEQLDYLSNAFE